MSHGGAAGKADAGVVVVVFVVVVAGEVAPEGALFVGAVFLDRGGLVARGVEEEQPASTPEITRAGTTDHRFGNRIRSTARFVAGPNRVSS